MKPILIIGAQLLTSISFLYATFFTIYELDGWYAPPTSFLCFTASIFFFFTTLLAINSYSPGPKQ